MELEMDETENAGDFCTLTRIVVQTVKNKR